MPSLLDDFMTSRPAAEPTAPFVDTDPFDEEQKRYAGMAEELDQQMNPVAPPHKPIFRYENKQQTDGDPYGDLTVQAGQMRGLPWLSDDVKELNFFGRVIPYEVFSQVEGGEALARLTARQRTGRRGFTEAISKGSWLDFVPYAGDIASLGISVRNMSKVRDTMRKIEEGGVDKLSTQELVFAKLYMEDMERQSNSTWGGKVGSIVRSAPAFAAEFLTSGLLFKGAVKAAKAVGLVAQEGSERAVMKTARSLVSSKMRAAGGLVGLSEDALGEIAEEAARTAAPRMLREFTEKGVEGEAKNLAAEGLAALRQKALTEAVKVNTALQAPGGLRALGRFASEYTSRGLLDHADNVVRDLPKGFQNKMREALGIAFVEAPVKGGLYAAFDFYGMNPLIGAVAGADEVVTKQELQFSLSKDPQVRAMAKQLAFGSAWAEYASENSGRAFGAIGDMIGDLAKGTGRAVAKGLSATGPVGPTPLQQGSFIKRLFDKAIGTEESYLADLTGIKAAATKLAGGAEVTKEFLAQAAQTRGKTFWGYYIADKMSRLGLTPHGVARKMEQMGYDGIVEELLEERYSGFAQGLFGLDAAPSRPFMARLAEAWDQAIPDTASDFFAEAVAFAIPMGIRSASAVAYRGLGGSNIERAGTAGRSLLSITDALYGKVATVVDGKFVVAQEVAKATKGTGSVVETLAKPTTAEGYLGNVPGYDDTVDTFTELALNTMEQAPDSKRGLLVRVADGAIRAIEALSTGNPMMMFRSPVDAIMQEDLGNKGRVMMYEGHQFIRHAYAQQADILASQRKKGGGTSDPAADHAEITKAIMPNVRAAMDGIVKRYLRTSGVFVMDSKDVTNWIKGRQDGDGKIAGMPAAEFRKTYEKEIAAAAAGRLRANIQGESVTWAMEAEAPAVDASAADLQNDVEDFFAKEYGISPVRDGDAYDPTAAPVYAGRSVPWATIDLAASDSKSTEAEAVRMELIKATRGGFNFGAGPAALKRLFDSTRDYARKLRDAVVAFAPQAYTDKDGARFDVSLRDGLAVMRDAEGRSVGSPIQAASWQDVQKALTDQGYIKDPNTGIDVRYTAGNDLLFTRAAALIAHPMARQYLDNYMVGNGQKIAPSPYSAEVRKESKKTFAELRAGAEQTLALAQQWEDAGRDKTKFDSDADATNAENAWADALNDGTNGKPLGWEYAAQQALAFAGLEAKPSPANQNVRGWMMSAAAYNQNGVLYLPYRYLGNAAALVEDAAEIRFKNLSREVDQMRIKAATLGKAARETVRKAMDGKPAAEILVAEDAAADKAIREGTRNVSSLFAMYDVGTADRSVYRPAARAMVEATQTALLELSRSTSTDISERTRKEARALAAHVFNPDVYNIEAVSHLLSGVTFFHADEHRHGSGTAGSAYYATLGSIAPLLRNNRQVYLGWNSLVNRMIGGAPDGNMEALQNAYKSLTPGGYVDAAMKMGVPASAVTGDPAAEIGWVTGKRIPADAFNAAIGSEAKQQELVDNAWNAAVGGGNTRGLLPEDYPEFARAALRGVAGIMEYIAGPTGVDSGSSTAVQDAAANANAGEQVIDPPGTEVKTMSLADSVTEHPLFYSVLATSFVKHAKLRFGRTFPEPPDRKRQREAYKRWVFDYWVAANLGLGEGQYDKFSTQYDVERPAEIDELPETADRGFLDGVAALFGQEQDEADERGTSFGEFNQLDDNAAAEAAYRLALALQGVLDTHLPSAQGEAAVAVRLWREAAEARGDTGPESLRALLTAEDGTDTVHPVFTSEGAFRAWVQKRIAANPKKTELVLYATLEALGYKGSVRMLTALRGAMPVQGFTPRMDPPPPSTDGGIAVQGDTNDVGARFFTRASVAVENEAARGIQAVRNALGTKAPAYFKKIMDEIEAEAKKKFTFGAADWKPAASRAELLKEVGRRAGIVADFMDRLIGDGNTVSAALRSRHVIASLVDDHIRGIKNNRKTDSVLEYALATQTNGGIGNFAHGVMRAAEAAANGAAPDTVASMLHEDGWGQAARIKRNPGERSSLSEALDYYGESIHPIAARAAGEGGKREKLIDSTHSPAVRKFIQSPLFTEMSALADPDATAADVKRNAGLGLWADGTTPISGRSVGIVDSAGRDRAEPTVLQLVLAAIGDVTRIRAGNKQGVVPVYLPKGGHRGNAAVMVPAKYFMTAEMDALSSDIERYNKAYAAMMESMRADTVGGPRRDAKRMPVIFTGTAAPAPIPTRAEVTVVAGEHMKGGAIHGSATGLERIAFAMLDAIKQRMKKIHIHGMSPDGGYMFSKANFMDAEGTAEDPAVHPAERALAKHAMAAIKKGYAQAVVMDMDPFKLDPRKDIVAQLLNGEKEADSEVQYGGETTTPAKLGLRLSEIEVGADAAGNPIMVRAVSFDADLRVTRAATLHDSAEARPDAAESVVEQRPGTAEDHRMTDDFIHSAVALNDLYYDLYGEKLAPHDAERDPLIRDLLATGVFPIGGPHFNDRAEAALGTQRVTDPKGSGCTLHATAGGGAIEGLGVSGTAVLDAETVNGVYHPALVQANIRLGGWERPALAFNETDPRVARNLPDAEKRDTVEAEWKRLEALRGLPDAYKAALADFQKMFVYQDGSPLPAGRALTFADLAFRGAFDKGAWRKTPQGATLLGGTGFIISRVPGVDHARARHYVRWSGPSTSNQEGATVRGTTFEGKTAVFEAGPFDSPDDALVGVSAGTHLFTGHDNDGDAIFESFPRFTRDGSLDVGAIDLAAATKELRAAKSEGEAKKILSRHIARLSNSMLNARHDLLTRNGYGVPRHTTPEFIPVALLEKLSGGIGRFSFTDALADAELTDAVREEASLRGIIVALGAALDRARALGLDLFKAAVTPFVSADGRALGPVIVGPGGVAMDDALHVIVKSVIDDVANATYDNEKKIARLVRAGFGAPFMGLFVAALYGSGVTKHEQVAALAESYSAWAKSPAGQAVRRQYMSRTDSTVDAPIKGVREGTKWISADKVAERIAKSLYGVEKDEMGREYVRSKLWEKADPQARSLAMAAAQALKGTDEARRAQANGMLVLMGAQGTLRDLKTVLEADKDSVASVDKAQQLGKAHKRLSELGVDGWRMDRAAEMIDAARDARSGHVRYSRIERTGQDKDQPAADDSDVVLTAQAYGALSVTPIDLLDSVLSAIETALVNPGNPLRGMTITQAYKVSVEHALIEMLGKHRDRWAEARDVSRLNPFLTGVRVPAWGKNKKGVWEYPSGPKSITMRSSDTAVSGSALRGFLALENETDGSLDITFEIGDVKVKLTPRDMAALLKVYFAITAQIPLGPGRSATTAAGFVAPALSDVLYGAWNAAQGTGKGNAGFLADLAQSARENRQKYQAGRARLDLFDMPGVLAFAGTENLNNLKASHAKWQAGISVKVEVVETVAPASREAKAEDAPRQEGARGMMDTLEALAASFNAKEADEGWRTRMTEGEAKALAEVEAAPRGDFADFVEVVDRDAGITRGEDFSEAPAIIMAYQKNRAVLLPLLKTAVEKGYGGSLVDMLRDAVRNRPLSDSERGKEVTERYAREVAAGQMEFMLPVSSAASVAISKAALVGFQGYKGGFEDVGKGTPTGDGKDKAMRDVVTSAKVPGFIGEIADTGRRSSTKTSLIETASHAGGNSTKTAGVTHSSLPMFMGSGDGYAAGEFKVMLARNGEFGGRSLAADTVASVRAAAKAGASFIVGDMPGVDSAFVDLLRDIGAPFEIYHTGSTPRIRAEAAPIASAASVAISKAAAESANAAANTEITQGLFADPLAQLAVLRTDPNADRNKQAAEAFGAGLRAAVSTVVPWADDGLRAAAARASEAIAAVGYVSPKLASGAWLAIGSDARRRNVANGDAVEQIATMLKNAKLGTTVLLGEYTTAARTIQPAVAEVGRRVRQAPAYDAAAATLGYAAAMTTGIKDADAAARAAGRAMKALGLVREATMSLADVEKYEDDGQSPAPIKTVHRLGATLARSSLGRWGAPQDGHGEFWLEWAEGHDPDNSLVRLYERADANLRGSGDYTKVVAEAFGKGVAETLGGTAEWDIGNDQQLMLGLEAIKEVLDGGPLYEAAMDSGGPGRSLLAHTLDALDVLMPGGRHRADAKLYLTQKIEEYNVRAKANPGWSTLDPETGDVLPGVPGAAQSDQWSDDGDLSFSLADSQDRDEAVTSAAVKAATARVGAFAYRTLDPEQIREDGRPEPGEGTDAVRHFNDTFKPMAMAAVRTFVSSGREAAARMLRNRVASANPSDREAVRLAAEALDREFLREWEEKADAISYKRDPVAYEQYAEYEDEQQIKADEAAMETAAYREMLSGQESGMDEFGVQALGYFEKRDVPENLTQGTLDLGSASLAADEPLLTQSMQAAQDLIRRLEARKTKAFKYAPVPIPDNVTSFLVDGVPVSHPDGVVRYEKSDDGWSRVEYVDGDVYAREQVGDDAVDKMYNKEKELEAFEEFQVDQAQGRTQETSYSGVAQVVEEWKQANGVKYDPQEAYSRGEGFFHDLGAFNPNVKSLWTQIGKALLGQSRALRNGDLRYWENPENQVVVSAYTALSSTGTRSKKPFAEIFAFSVSVGNDPNVEYKKIDGKWYTSSYILGEVPVAETSVKWAYDNFPSGTKAVRPGSGPRFVIRPSWQDIVWAAVGDVYSGTVTAPHVGLDIFEDTEGRFGAPGGFYVDNSQEEGGAWFSSKEEARAFIDEMQARQTSVDPKAPQADKLSLLAHSIAAAIEGRGASHYNELGIRLRLGNFYIEDGAEQNGAPAELRRLNEHLKRAFLRVQGSLDPVAPYQPKTIRRAGGEVTFSVAEQSLDDLVESAFRIAADSVAGSRDLVDTPADDKTKKSGPRRKTHASALDAPVNAMLARDRDGAFKTVAARLRAAAAEVKAAAPANDESSMTRDVAVGVLEDLATYLENAKLHTDPRAYNELMNIGGRAVGERSSAAAYLRGLPGGAAYEAAHAVGISLVAKNQQSLRKQAANAGEMPPFVGNVAVKQALEAAQEAAELNAPHAEALKGVTPTAESAGAVGAVIGDGNLGAARSLVLAKLDAADALLYLSTEAKDALKSLRIALTGDATARAANGLGANVAAASEIVKTALTDLRAELARESVAEYEPAAKSARQAIALAEEASSTALATLAAMADTDVAHAASGRAAGAPPAVVTEMKKSDAAAELGRAALMRSMQISSRDPLLGTPDYGDEFRFNFIDPRVWFANVIIPDLWGADARKILLDKTALLELPRAINVANDVSKTFAVSTATGEILAYEQRAGSGIRYNDGKVVKETPGSAMTRWFARGTLPKALVHSTVHHDKMLSDVELQQARWALRSAYSIAQDGADGRLSLNMDLDLADVWRVDLLGPAGAANPGLRVLDVMFDRDARKAILAKSPGQRPFATDVLMDRLFESLPQGSPLYGQFIGALKDAVEKAYKNNRLQSVRERTQAVYHDLYEQKRTVRQVRTAEGGLQEHYNVRVAVPNAESVAYWEGSDAHAKLMRNKRTAEDLDLRNVAAKVADEQGRIDRHAASMGWMVDGDGRLFGNSPLAPFFKGAGAFRYGMSRTMTSAPPGYREAVIKQLDSLERIPTHETVRDEETNEEYEVPITLDSAAGQQRFARLFSYLRDLRPDVFEDGQASAVEIANAIESDPGVRRRLDMPENPKVWDAALAVHRAASRRLLESAWNNGEKTDARMADVPIEAFNNMIGAMIAERAPAFRRGVTATEIYELTGAQPLNLGADEALTRHASEVATMSRWRLAINQMLLATDHEGMPLYYARPGEHADDAVSDDMWGYVARRWVQIHGRPGDTTVFYDEAKSGRENAKAMYDVITPNKKALSSVREARGGVERYTLKSVALPPGMETFSALDAQADPPGDDTKAAMNAVAGGEAAAMAEQIMAVPGFTGVGEGWKYVNRFWSWSKSLSVMNSLFFPIATAFESPVAATGMTPTLLGFTGSGSRFMRWAGKDGGVVARSFGLDPDAPGMSEIMRYIGSDDPGLLELRINAEAAGLMSNDRAKNMWDHDRQVIAKDINAVVAKAEATFGKAAAKNLRVMLEGTMQNSSELAFEYIINATKFAVFAQMNNRLRNQALRAGRWWDPIRDMKKWAHYINGEVGGIDPAMYPWMTPKMQQWLKAGMFSWAWTLGAWSAGGGDVVTAKLFGLPAGKQMRGFMFTRWMRMYFGVMVGVPAVMQIVCTALGKAAGDDDEDDKKSAANDKWGVWENEKNKRWKAWDITPMLRAMKNAPTLPVLASAGAIMGKIGGGWKGAAVGGAVGAATTWLAGLSGKTLGEAKEALPETVMGLPVGALIPANTGQEGSMPTTRRRRYYMNLGKQGWEVARWFEDPTGSFLGKMSLPAQKILEGILGVNPASGFDTPFKDMSFWDRWTSLDGDKSALLNLGKAWLPFSYQGTIRNPEAGALSAVGVISKGTSKTTAVKEMATMFSQWSDADGYAAMVKANPGAWTDLRRMAVEWLNAVRINGYDPETELKNAVALARRDLYEKVHAALPQYPTGKGDRQALEEAARGLYRLNVVHKNLLQSIKARDKNQNIKRTGDFLDKSNKLLRESFDNPHGIRTDERLDQSADLGGDVSGFLATDEVPTTVLGYRVLRTEELSEGDLKFFTDNPDVAGFFEKTGGRGPDGTRAADKGGDVRWSPPTLTADRRTDSERAKATREGDEYVARYNAFMAKKDFLTPAGKEKMFLEMEAQRDEAWAAAQSGRALRDSVGAGARTGSAVGDAATTLLGLATTFGPAAVRGPGPGVVAETPAMGRTGQEMPQDKGVVRRSEKDFSDTTKGYRVVGEDAILDLLGVGRVRSSSRGRDPDEPPIPGTSIRLGGRTTPYASFARDKPSLGYNQSPERYIIETDLENLATSTLHRHGRGSTMFPKGSSPKGYGDLDLGKVKIWQHLGEGEYAQVDPKSIVDYAKGDQ